MRRESPPPLTARALAAYLAGHPLVWVCGLPGGPFVGVVSRIDGDTLELTAIAGGRRRHILLPAGWNSRARKAPVRTQAIREAFRFHADGFHVWCCERREPDEVVMLHVRYIDELSPFAAPGPSAVARRPRAVRCARGGKGPAKGGPDGTT